MRMNLDHQSYQSAIGVVQDLSRRAKESGNLSLVFGSNGQYGRRATGNFTLLAMVTGISRKHVGAVLTGKTDPSYATLMKLSEVTGVEVGAISKYIQDQKRKAA